MVHQLAGLGDHAESPPGLEYWERDGDLSEQLLPEGSSEGERR